VASIRQARKAEIVPQTRPVETIPQTELHGGGVNSVTRAARGNEFNDNRTIFDPLPSTGGVAQDVLDATGALTRATGTMVGRGIFALGEYANSVPLMLSPPGSAPERFFLNRQNKLAATKEILFPKAVTPAQESISSLMRRGVVQALEPLTAAGTAPVGEQLKETGRHIVHSTALGLVPGVGRLVREPTNPDSVLGEALTGVGFLWTGGAKKVVPKKINPLKLDDKGGRFRDSRSLFAGDDVPETIFGYPVVSKREDYTEEDLEFFREYPEAGGYYDDGDDPDGEMKGDMLGGETFQSADFNTPLPKGSEDDYVKWVMTLPKNLRYEGDYDLRGYWLDPDTVKTVVTGDHFIDKYKKPNHPTFSNESKYAAGKYAEWAGFWNGDKYVPSTRRKVEDAIREVIPFIKEERHEGFHEKAYKCAAGKWTIGYGQTVITDPKTGRERAVVEGDTISRKDAADFVERRVRSDAKAINAAHPDWKTNLSKGALAALLDVAYNLGHNALSEKRSPTLNAELDAVDMDYDSIVWQELPTYVNIDGKESAGLVSRRNDAIRKWRE
jgi:GH24 family phage-related lysozyme (muramidase)